MLKKQNGIQCLYSIGLAEVRIGDSVIMVSDAQEKWIEQFGYVSSWPD
jgi:hypothetical protein